MQTTNINKTSFSETIDVTTDILKSNPPKHPVLQRLSAKLNDEINTGNLISRYDRMHHRHNRT